MKNLIQTVLMAYPKVSLQIEKLKILKVFGDLIESEEGFFNVL